MAWRGECVSTHTEYTREHISHADIKYTCWYNAPKLRMHEPTPHFHRHFCACFILTIHIAICAAQLYSLASYLLIILMRLLPHSCARHSASIYLIAYMRCCIAPPLTCWMADRPSVYSTSHRGWETHIGQPTKKTTQFIDFSDAPCHTQ